MLNIQCLIGPCEGISSDIYSIPPVIASSSIPIPSLMTPYQSPVINPPSPHFKTETVSLDWYRLVFLAIGVWVGIVVLSK